MLGQRARKPGPAGPFARVAKHFEHNLKARARYHLPYKVSVPGFGVGVGLGNQNRAAIIGTIVYWLV